MARILRLAVSALALSLAAAALAPAASSKPFTAKDMASLDRIDDTRSMGYATEELWFDEWEQGGAFYDTPEAHEKFNPSNHVKAWSKPMLVIHGGRDYRIPLAQALGAFTALQRQGIESNFCTSPTRTIGYSNRRIQRSGTPKFWVG